MPLSKSTPKISLPSLKAAQLENESRAVLIFSDALQVLPKPSDFTWDSGKPFTRIWRQGAKRLALEGGPFERTKLHRITLPNGESYPLLPEGLINRMYTDKPLGLVREHQGYTLRFHCPRARDVRAVFFHEPGEEAFAECGMEFNADDGTWEVSTDILKPGDLYGYQVVGPEDSEDVSQLIFADPYAHAVCKQNNWQRPSLSLILPEDTFSSPVNDHVWLSGRDLIIYESHIKDFTQLNRNIPYILRGSYRGAAQTGTGTSLSHIKNMGVNVLEWLPLHDYDYYEPPYDQPTNNIHNTWNRYARNHWGYMTSGFFAPEARYASNSSPQDNAWIGRDGRQVTEYRELVKSCHQQGIAVFMDVVFNHVAQYGQNALRMIDPIYSLRQNVHGNRIDHSHCGNDLKTERPMIRRLIVDSLFHFVENYGVDGFRFDLAGLLDGDTLDTINREVRGKYPHIHLIAEPWGGRYDKHRFSKRGWGSWNDRFRDGIRGYHPVNSPAFACGEIYSSTSEEMMLPLVTGSLVQDGGPFLEEKHSVNFVSCHDGYTIADFFHTFIKDKLKKTTAKKPVHREDEIDRYLRLTWLILLTSRGAVMFHQGDEWGFSKRISDEAVSDPHIGKIDENSYNKDNPTNWLNWEELEKPANADLKEYVRKLIGLRKKCPAIRLARRDNIELQPSKHRLGFSYRITLSRDDIVICLNASPADEVLFSLPQGRWSLIADHKRVLELDHGSIREGSVTVPAIAGAVLRKLKPAL
ncbi:hypothetical protein K8I28_02900 [bacterium]|nr:hypothetical protein [bacterium]